MSSLLVVLTSALIAAAGFVAWRVGRSHRGSHASCMEDVVATVLFVSVGSLHFPHFARQLAGSARQLMGVDGEHVSAAVVVSLLFMETRELW